MHLSFVAQSRASWIHRSTKLDVSYSTLRQTRPFEQHACEADIADGQVRLVVRFGAVISETQHKLSWRLVGSSRAQGSVEHLSLFTLVAHFKRLRQFLRRVASSDGIRALRDVASNISVFFCAWKNECGMSFHFDSVSLDLQIHCNGQGPVQYLDPPLARPAASAAAKDTISARCP